ncbi:hypothetical protein XENORESO_002109 [Xenotaenia resolanae]|uniref:Uncharacterized protein n=1 Tax=Xenotaenia resolanae TaxID=208358 RepID=A0ABV0VWQ4_9TELE
MGGPGTERASLEMQSRETANDVVQWGHEGIYTSGRWKCTSRLWISATCNRPLVVSMLKGITFQVNIQATEIQDRSQIPSPVQNKKISGIKNTPPGSRQVLTGIIAPLGQQGTNLSVQGLCLYQVADDRHLDPAGDERPAA